uniref:Pyrin domain-containing protein n=1 Tax=Cyprinodon variegatus TaxID=28743 RepID=A0A3Q2EBD3_CYPVA
MYSEENLSDFMDELTDDEFRRFKWHLKKETWNNIPPIKQAQLDKCDRLDTVDLMVQKYQLSGAATVMGIILEKQSRNDLINQTVSNLSPTRPI